MWIDFIKTCLIELPIFWWLLRLYDNSLRIIGIGLLINLSTWPFITYYYYQYGGNILLLEMLRTTAEFLWVKQLWPASWKRSFW
ncbi:MAG: hypothetical protein R2822_03650 [Spirosomataceae bacterium]